MNGIPMGPVVSPVFTVKEVAALLKTSPHTIQWYIKRGDLIAFSIGRGFRVQARDLQAFIDEKKHAMHGSAAMIPDENPA
jgi:excisionase family DNA binding protein